MNFLLTRPEEDIKKLAIRLKVLGHGVTCEPLLTIKYLPPQETDLAKFQALLFTSANGVRAFARHNSSRHMTCFAVGDATAATTKAAGFTTIFTAGGDVDRLAALVVRTLEDKTKALLHVSGTDIAGNLSALLEKSGFQVTRLKLYTAVKATGFSSATQDALRAGHITHIPFYSPRTAQSFMDIIQQHNLSGPLSKITALCLSSAVSNVIKSPIWGSILTAAHPDQDSLFTLIDVKLKEDRQ
ncbi:MAG: uroporphyrinogen-III synthase [Emcibacter sp.]|nr:uroporphyrinogen-III synthase [Emcibacter sp.]